MVSGQKWQFIAPINQHEKLRRSSTIATRTPRCFATKNSTQILCNRHHLEVVAMPWWHYAPWTDCSNGNCSIPVCPGNGGIWKSPCHTASLLKHACWQTSIPSHSRSASLSSWLRLSAHDDRNQPSWHRLLAHMEQVPHAFVHCMHVLRWVPSGIFVLCYVLKRYPRCPDNN